MEETGRATPGLGGKPATSGPGSMIAGSNQMPPSSRYGYQPSGQAMLGPYASVPSGHVNHNNMSSHHQYPSTSSFGPNIHQQMHLQQQQQGAQHGVGNYLPSMPAMPPPSQYPNKHLMHGTSGAPGQPPPATPGPSQHVPYPMDRSAYYGSRAPVIPHQQMGYFQRHQMPIHPGKNFYPNGNGTPGPIYQNQPHPMSGPLMSGQHTTHVPPHQPSVGQLPMLPHQQPMHQGNYISNVNSSNIEINSPSASPGVSNASLNSSLNNHNGTLRGPQPPSILDEVSQASTASSSLAAEDSCASTDMPLHKLSKHHHSHPPTPNTSNLGSPGAASLSSFHDDFDSVSSPSWPRTPASPAINNCHFDHAHHPKRSDGLQKLYDMSDDPERRLLLDKLFQFSEERGTPLSQVPTISKIPVDLYRLYISVKERGGFVEVTKGKMWKECAQICGIPNSSSASYTLRKQYMKHLLPFECKFDRGGIDPGPVLAALEASNTSSRKKSTSTKSTSGASTPNTPRLSPNEPAYHHSAASGTNYEMEHHAGPYQVGPSMPPYHGHAPPAPNAYPPSEYAYSGQAGNNSGHRLTPHLQANHESVSVKDPFADEESPNSTAQSSASSIHRPHFAATPGDQNSFYRQIPPSSQSQSHSSNVPFVESVYQGQYAEGGQYSRLPPEVSNLSEPIGGAMSNPYQQYGSTRGPASVGGANGPIQQAFPYGSYPQQQSSGSHPQPFDQSSAHPRATYEHPGSRVAKTESYTPSSSAANPITTSANTYQSGNNPAFPPVSMHTSSHQRIESPHPVPSQEIHSKNHDNINPAQNSTRMQSPLAQRLLAAKVPQCSAQIYGNAPYTSTMAMSGSTGTLTTPSSHSKQSVPQQQTSSNVPWIPPTTIRYPVPKRHPDFMKPSDHYAVRDQAYSSQASYGGPSRPPPPVTATSSAPTGWNRDNHRPPGSFNSSQSGAYSSGKDSWHDSRQPEPSSSTGPDSQVPNNLSNRYIEYNSASTSQYSGPHSCNSKPVPVSQTSCSNTRCESRSGFLPPGVQPVQKKTTPGNSSTPSCPVTSSPATHPPPGSLTRRDSLFPLNTVEATLPTMSKRRKITARDLSPVEAWRLYMSLKSGLLAESTYALDVLNIYSNDDSTLCFLSLTNMPGMLEVLLEHYKRYLNEMFNDLFSDTEIGHEKEEKKVGKEMENNYRQMVTTWNRQKELDCENMTSNRKWYELAKDVERNDELCDSEEEDDQSYPKYKPSDKIVLLNTTNYTYVTRYGKPVKTNKTKNLFITDFEKKWDKKQKGFSSNRDHWTKGGGETTGHILTHIEPKDNSIRFVRVIQSNKDKIIQPGNDSMKHANGFENGGSSETNNNVKKQPKCNNNENDQQLEEFLQNEEEYPKIRQSDRERYWKRKHEPEFEDESYEQEETPVSTGRDYQDSLKSRCLTVSNLIRNLTFVPGNDIEMCRHAGLILILSRLITLHHVHAHKRKRRISEIDCSKLSSEKIDETTLFNLVGDVQEKLPNEKDAIREPDWWWDSLHIIRENTLVMLANLSGQLNLANCPEETTLAILDGLLHWATCPSAYAQDALPTAHVSLSPRRLAYETLSKLSILESNVDLILATPPWSRIDQFIAQLSRSLGRHEDQTMREFSIVLLSNFAAADNSIARAIALSGQTVSLLIGFIEQAEQSALSIVNTQGMHVFRDNPELIGTTLDMIGRCAYTLRDLARVPQNRTLFIQHEPRLLLLGMSPMFDQHILSAIADVLYEVSRHSPRSSSPGPITRTV